MVPRHRPARRVLFWTPLDRALRAAARRPAMTSLFSVFVSEKQNPTSPVQELALKKHAVHYGTASQLITSV
jgi:hypothetical protein